MKTSFVRFLFILALFFHIHSLLAEQLITLFLKQYPVIQPMVQAQKFIAKIHQPAKLARYQTKRLAPSTISGIFATYGGYLTASDLTGEISFPWRHDKPLIHLLVTQELTPIVRSGNTIDHWELQEGVPVKAYKMEQKWDNSAQTLYWDITQEPAPANNIIPLESIVIFSDPKYIYVPLGIEMAKETPHLLLPDIYIKHGINLTENALYVVNLSHYFGGILPIFKKDKTRYSRHLTY